jgi:hypothetical protein
MIHRLQSSTSPQPLPLSTAAPKIGDSVWLVGLESGKRDRQQLYECKVLAVSDDEFEYAGVNPVNPWDFSGGPVVNEKGAVVGNLLAGNRTGSHLVGVTVAVIRRRLRENGIEVD